MTNAKILNKVHCCEQNCENYKKCNKCCGDCPNSFFKIFSYREKGRVTKDKESRNCDAKDYKDQHQNRAHYRWRFWQYVLSIHEKKRN